MRAGRKHKPKPHTLARTRLSSLPRCPAHLDTVAQKEWRRLATPLHEAGLLTLADRAALAAYCQAYARWAEAEERLKDTPPLLKTPSGYVQQSPWLTVVNKRMELMARFMSELGLTPVARTRLDLSQTPPGNSVTEIQIAAFEWEGDAQRAVPRDRSADRAQPVEDLDLPVTIDADKLL